MSNNYARSLRRKPLCFQTGEQWGLTSSPTSSSCSPPSNDGIWGIGSVVPLAIAGSRPKKWKSGRSRSSIQTAMACLMMPSGRMPATLEDSSMNNGECGEQRPECSLTSTEMVHFLLKNMRPIESSFWKIETRTNNIGLRTIGLRMIGLRTTGLRRQVALSELLAKPRDEINRLHFLRGQLPLERIVTWAGSIFRSPSSLKSARR